MHGSSSRTVDEDNCPSIHTMKRSEQVQTFANSGEICHEREVPGEYGGPRKAFNYPYTDYKPHSGEEISRCKNLQGHLHRIHPNNAARCRPYTEQTIEWLSYISAHDPWKAKIKRPVDGLKEEIHDDYLPEYLFGSSNTGATIDLEEPDPLQGRRLFNGCHRLLAHMISDLMVSDQSSIRYEDPDILLHLERGFSGDWIIRGPIWVEQSFPAHWFSDETDVDDKPIDIPSMPASRTEHVLWLGMNLACHKRWTLYDEQTSHVLALGSPNEQYVPASGDGPSSYHSKLVESFGEKAAVIKSVLSGVARNFAGQRGTLRVPLRYLAQLG